MKVNLQQALTGRSLRNDIFKTIGNRSLHSLSALLRRSRQRDSRYLPYSSQHTILQAESPIRHVNFSRPLSPSPPFRLGVAGKGSAGKGTGEGGGKKVQRMKGMQDSSKSRNKSSKKSKGRQPSSQQHKDKEKPSSKERVRGGSSSLAKSRNNFSSKGKSSGSKQRRSSSSHPSRKSKLDLSSILQHGQERVVTPSSHTRRQRSRRSGEKTHKKSRKEELTAPICNRLERLCRDPMKFLKVMKSQWLTVRVRVQRRRIIELEVLTHKELARLAIVLDRGNLDCQHIQERYLSLPAGSRLALFSCVRTVDIDRPSALPKIHIEASPNEGALLDRHATLPYSWLLFASEGKPRPTSRICTKACLDEAEVDPQKLRTLTQTLPGWRSRHRRGQSWLSCQFSLGQEGIQFVARKTAGWWSLQVVGRGESRLQGLLAFLAAFLRPC